jgi:glycosyltransferase involved in cell wall biosynthesis
MENKPLVSVLMTAFNREKYIAEAIESILGSTYTNFELIIVDDCSNDKTVEIAKGYEVIDKRIKVYKNKTNLSQFPNRNKAASYAKGTYLKYVDSDDIIYPFSLRMMVDAMQQFPDAALGFCLTHGACRFPLPYKINSADAFKQHFFEGGLLFVGPSGLIIKRKVFEAVRGFEEFGMPSDNHLTLKIAAHYPVVAMNRDLFWWRVHVGQVFSQNKENYFNIVNNYRYTKDIILHYSPLESADNKKMLGNQKKIFLKNLYRLAIIKGKPLIALRLFLEILKPVSK